MKTSRFAINWFVDFDKEERWINEMSKAGWAFWHTNGVFYRFTYVYECGQFDETALRFAKQWAEEYLHEELF